jgi:hypothetical protein
MNLFEANSWLCNLNAICYNFIEFGSLTTSQLVEKVRGLQELAFQLGLEEGKLNQVHFGLQLVFV